MKRKDFLRNTGLGMLTAAVGFRLPAWASDTRGTPYKSGGNNNDEVSDLSKETEYFYVKLDEESQTLISLRPKSSPGFDFLPGDRIDKRRGDGFYNLGDITIRLRHEGASRSEER